MSSRTIGIFLLGIAIGLFPLPAGGAEPDPTSSPNDPGPRAILKERDETIRAIIAQEDTAEEMIKSQLRELINGIMDFPELAHRSLGQHWETLSAKDRSLFTRLFRELIELTSTKKLDIFKADRASYSEEIIRGDTAEVKSIISQGREEIEVVYLLHRSKGEWKVYDMIVDDLGLAENYRTQFNKIIQQSAFSGLVQRLRERIREEKTETQGTQ